MLFNYPLCFINYNQWLISIVSLYFNILKCTSISYILTNFILRKILIYIRAVSQDMKKYKKKCLSLTRFCVLFIDYLLADFTKLYPMHYCVKFSFYQIGLLTHFPILDSPLIFRTFLHWLRFRLRIFIQIDHIFGILDANQPKDKSLRN